MCVSRIFYVLCIEGAQLELLLLHLLLLWSSLGVRPRFDILHFTTAKRFSSIFELGNVRECLAFEYVKFFGLWILGDNGHLFHKSPRCIVDESIFKKSTEDEEDADAWPDVDSLGVGHWGQTPLDRAHGGGHGQQGGHPQGHPGWYRLVVQPEGEPGHQHDHEARDVDGQDVERQLSSYHNVD